MPTEKIETALGTIVQPLALNAAGDGEAGPPYEVPEWIQLTPNGPLLQGVDRRTFQMDDPDDVIKATRLPIALDWNHGSVTAMWTGASGEAAARIMQLEKRDDGVWGRCAWTGKGRESVESGHYFYISPTFVVRYDDDAPPAVKSFSSAALTNNPNLTFPALNQINPFMEPHPMPEETGTTAAGAAAPQTTGSGGATSGAPAEPTTGPAPNAQATDPGAGAATPAEPADAGAATLEQMRRELNAVRQELTDTRQELATQRTESDAERKRLRDTAINAAVDKAIETGRIPPAQREYFVAQCQKENGLEEFEAHVATLPQMVGDAGLAHRTPPGTDEVALTEAERQFCQASGIDPEKFLATKKEEQAAGRRIYPPGL